MLKILGISLIGIMLYWSCTSSANNVQIKDVHYSLLKDLYIADALVTKQPNHLRDSLRRMYVGQIAEIHEVSVESIDSIMENLQQNLLLYKTVSDSVLIELNNESKEMNARPSQQYSK